jgi:hypothetical protein
MGRWQTGWGDGTAHCGVEKKGGTSRPLILNMRKKGARGSTRPPATQQPQSISGTPARFVLRARQHPPAGTQVYFRRARRIYFRPAGGAGSGRALSPPAEACPHPHSHRPFFLTGSPQPPLLTPPSPPPPRRPPTLAAPRHPPCGAPAGVLFLCAAAQRY